MNYTESDIAAILAALNNAEIEAGKLAQKKAKDARVKRFAAMMVSQHQSANTKQNDTLKKLGLTASENSASRDLTSEGASDIESLKSQSGADFDKAYMDAMVRGHQKALTMLDDKLIPAAKSPEMKAQLQSVRGTVDAHLREAADIQKALSTTK
jgi:putative membrane protein